MFLILRFLILAKLDTSETLINSHGFLLRNELRESTAVVLFLKFMEVVNYNKKYIEI